MASQVYSVRLFNDVTIAGFNRDSSPVPAGYRWVIRSISARNYGTEANQGTKACVVEYVSTEGTFFIWETGPAVGNTGYYADMHQVIDAGELIRVRSAVDFWNFTISGYQLTLP